MATLNQEISQLKEQLDLSQKSGEAQHIISEYGQIFKRLKTPSDILHSSLEQYQILKKLPHDAPIKISVSEELKEQVQISAQSLKVFVEKWEELDYSSRQIDELDNAKVSLGTFNERFGQGIKDCWLAWTEKLENACGLDDFLLESQKSIPGLEEVYLQYKDSQSNFNNLLLSIAASEDAINQLEKQSEIMIGLKGQMQFKLPDEVSAFFKQLTNNTNGQVSLSMMTLNVFEWLQKKDLLKQYVLRRNRNNE